MTAPHPFLCILAKVSKADSLAEFAAIRTGFEGVVRTLVKFLKFGQCRVAGQFEISAQADQLLRAVAGDVILSV